MFCYIKIHLPYTLNIFKNVNPCIICVTMNYSFGNYLLTEFYSSSKCWCFILQYKNAFTSITIFLIRKASKHWEAPIFSEENTFSKILIFAWKCKFYYWQHIHSVLFLWVTGLLHSFWRKYLPNTVLVFFQAFFQVKLVLHEKKQWVWLIIQRAWVLASRQLSYL